MNVSIAIAGAGGAVGSTFLTHLLSANILAAGDRVILVGRPTSDSRTRRAALRIDLLDAFDEAEVELLNSDDLAEHSVDILVMAAGATLGVGITTRRALAPANAVVLQHAADRLARSSPEAIVVIVTNPVELGVAIFSTFFPRTQVIGMGAEQDSLRFARAIAVRLGIRRSRVQASVLGEHGDAMFPVWRSVVVLDSDAAIANALQSLRRQYEHADSSLVDAVQLGVKALVAAEDVEHAYGLVAGAPPQVRAQVESFITASTLGSTPNATANATLAFVGAVRAAGRRVLHGQVLLAGEIAGLEGVCGMPLHVDKRGWRLAHADFTPEERAALARATAASSYVFDLPDQGEKG